MTSIDLPRLLVGCLFATSLSTAAAQKIAYPDPPPPTPKLSAHMGMTWGVLRLRSPDPSLAFVGCRGEPKANAEGCDAYRGDTACSQALPLLCLRPKQESIPEGAVAHCEGCWNPGNSYSRWAGGVIALTPAVRGESLLSRGVADAYCATYFGAGWRLAEHHDGWGWGLASRGTIADHTRFWVAINDQRANCWDTVSAP